MFHDQRLTIRFGADSSGDEGMNRDISVADESLLINVEVRRAGATSASGLK